MTTLCYWCGDRFEDHVVYLRHYCIHGDPVPMGPILSAAVKKAKAEKKPRASKAKK